MVAMRRVASPSRGVMPFQMPQTFSQLSQPTPLKKANWRSSVLSRFQRSRDVDHVARFQPFETIHRGHKRKLILPPGHHIPGDCLIGGAAFGLKCQRMADFLGGQREGQRHAILRIAVDAVGVDLLHEFRDGLRPGLPGSRVPWSHIIMGNSTRTPRRWKSATICCTPATPPGMERTMSC